MVRADDTPNVVSQASLNRILRGTYAFGSNATDDGLAPSVGTLTFDGNGGLTGVMNLNGDGTVCADMTLGGTYVVNADRTATASLVLTSVATANCASKGNNDTLALSLSFGANSARLPAATVYFTEMDPLVAGTFANTFDPIGGIATLR